MLQDGSTALVITPGYRLKFNLNELLEGGDDAKENCAKEAAKKAKRTAKYKGKGGKANSDGDGGYSSAWVDKEDMWIDNNVSYGCRPNRRESILMSTL